MVGLSIVLETTNNDGVTSPTPHQVVNKSAVKVTAATKTVCLSRGTYSGFLEHCFLCRRKLLPAKDVYMYQGDRTLCSVECRSKQMIMDEEENLRGEKKCSVMDVKTKKTDSPSPSPSSSDGHLRHRRDLRNRADGFAYSRRERASQTEI